MDRLKILQTIILLFVCGQVVSQSENQNTRQLAITIDDPNTYVTPSLGWEERNDRILKALENYHIKSALFVCGMRVHDSIGARLLKTWDERNHIICNHSYSHFYFNSNSKTSKVFINDFRKGDSLICHYNNYTKLFRFPFLKEGNTASKRDSMRAAMQVMGYKNGYVTIDASDWFIDTKIIEELKKSPQADLTPYKEYYIEHIINRADYYDSLAKNIFNRKVKHTLLLHHSLLNALFLDDLLKALESNGWKLIDATEAYEDSIFNLKPIIEPCGESLVWQCAKLDTAFSKGLRYPAEDSKYEELPLKQYIEEYRLRNEK